MNCTLGKAFQGRTRLLASHAMVYRRQGAHLAARSRTVDHRHRLGCDHLFDQAIV